MAIELCDYTLRTGTGLKTSEVRSIAVGLARAGIENIELGRLTDASDIAAYTEMLRGMAQDASFSMMMDAEHFDCIDYTRLPECNGILQKIRLPLHREAKAKTLETARMLAGKGYKSIYNIEGIYTYSDMELLQLCEEIRGTDADQVTIADSTTLIDCRPLQRIALLLDNNLAPQVKIGLCSEGNAQLSHFIADSFLAVSMQQKRTVVVEGTLFGRGNPYGCICTECMADLLNEGFGASYDYGELIRLISTFMPESNADPGNSGAYHPAFYLSAKNHVDGEYSRYFLSKGILLSELDAVLKKVAETQSFCLFDESVAEQVQV